MIGLTPRFLPLTDERCHTNSQPPQSRWRVFSATVATCHGPKMQEVCHTHRP